MTRWLPAVALGAAMALVGIIAVGLLGGGTLPTASERADALARELRCPDCQGLSVADSPTGSAQEIRRQVDDLVASGATDDEVREHFVARYGEWILLAPTAPAAWIVPYAVVLGSALALAAWLWRSRRAVTPAGQPAGAPLALTDEDRRQVREEAEALDG